MSGDGKAQASRIVIVGASLAGLRAAEILREEGFDGSLTLIGDEPYEPYDRPPLSKQVLLGRIPAQHTGLPGRRPLDAEWRLGVRATGLDLARKRVRLAPVTDAGGADAGRDMATRDMATADTAAAVAETGNAGVDTAAATSTREDADEIEFDQLLIATGVRARPWPNAAEAALDGVFALRTSEDARRLGEWLDAGPSRVLVVGAGFTGSEIASACRERGLEVTVVERGAAPLVGALGGVLGSVAADMQREHGVDLRCGVTVLGLEGDGNGRLARVRLSDGNTLDVDVAVIALGAIRNTEWLAGSGLGAGPRGVACDAGCRAFDIYGIVTDDIFVAGDVARFPHPLYEYQMLALEHWGNAVAQAEIAAHNMVNAGPRRRPHLSVPAFWSAQFGVNIKSVGVPTFSDSVAIVQGSVEDRRFVAVYGYRGRVTAAVAFDQAKWLDFYRTQIESAAPFPPEFPCVDRPDPIRVFPSDVPDPAVLSHGPTVALTGHLPDERQITLVRPSA